MSKQTLQKHDEAFERPTGNNGELAERTISWPPGRRYICGLSRKSTNIGGYPTLRTPPQVSPELETNTH